jgi:AhpD family alkylhydroperoxidase
MSRLAVPGRDDVREALNAVHSKLGVLPNFFRRIGSNTAVRDGFGKLSDALDEVLDLKSHERIGLAVGQVNECDYCLSAHHYTALNVARMYPEEIDSTGKDHPATRRLPSRLDLP